MKAIPEVMKDHEIVSMLEIKVQSLYSVRVGNVASTRAYGVQDVFVLNRSAIDEEISSILKDVLSDEVLSAAEDAIRARLFSPMKDDYFKNSGIHSVHVQLRKLIMENFNAS